MIGLQAACRLHSLYASADCFKPAAEPVLGIRLRGYRKQGDWRFTHNTRPHCSGDWSWLNMAEIEIADLYRPPMPCSEAVPLGSILGTLVKLKRRSLRG